MSSVVSLRDFQAKKQNTQADDRTESILDDMYSRDADPVLIYMVEDGFEHIRETFGVAATLLVALNHEIADDEGEEYLRVIAPVYTQPPEDGDSVAVLFEVQRALATPRTIRNYLDTELDARHNAFRKLQTDIADQMGNPTLPAKWAMALAFIAGACYGLMDTEDAETTPAEYVDGSIVFAARVEDAIFNVRIAMDDLVKLATRPA